MTTLIQCRLGGKAGTGDRQAVGTNPALHLVNLDLPEPVSSSVTREQEHFPPRDAGRDEGDQVCPAQRLVHPSFSLSVCPLHHPSEGAGDLLCK